ncbi:MAG: alginate lyase family protein [Lachnospiraceae bacterium]|nr:alginate lyase family protein [Lachnospiraceae bacterium]
MANVMWLFRRLKAMSFPEILWRISQKKLQRREEKTFKYCKMAVTDRVFNDKLANLQIDASRMHLNLKNGIYEEKESIPLLGGYDYDSYKKKWNAGFQTENQWPEVFSYSLQYKQRDDIGDARTNWELNRHFQFALLAKNYAATGKKEYIDELENLFTDWNKSNPFLWGISWTSVMEVAIRCSNWCYAYCFLEKSKVSEELLEQLRVGILNMTDYIEKHYSRYSSANNHLIVEAFSIGQAGILFKCKKWIELAVEILTRELTLQNYSDGINKELSLHYQSFYMEAMGLMMRLMIKNEIDVPSIWYEMLDKMSCYVANCMGEYGEVVVFGDDDEGKILDLQGGYNHYQYVLGLYSFLLDKQYINLKQINCENLEWLFGPTEKTEAVNKQLYKAPKVASYKEGGNTIIRSDDGRVLIGIDHAELGFGSIAAHGHADALSFQMFVDGQAVFVDPGTYIYHCDIESRNAYRKTQNHNTVCVNGQDQSEMLGAFLWGKRAKCKLLSLEEEDGKVVIEAEHDGYKPICVKRRFEFNKHNYLLIKDVCNSKSVAKFLINPKAEVNIKGNIAEIYLDTVHIIIKSSNVLNEETVKISHCYGIEAEGTVISATINDKELFTEIQIL